MSEKFRSLPSSMEQEIQQSKNARMVDDGSHPSFPTLIRDLTASKDNAEADLTELGEKAGVRLPRIKW